jgi:hypothetical protein
MKFYNLAFQNITAMKKKIIWFFVMILLVGGGCKAGKKTTATIPEHLMEDHASGPYVFKAGAFYTYVFTDAPGYISDDKAIINKLLASKIPVKDIWFKQGSSSCVPPGSDMAMTVMVEPVFLVRLERPSDEITGMGFKKTDEPGLGDCAYYVRRYTFK